MGETRSFANFIGGEFVPAVHGEWLAHYDPSTSAVVAQVANSELMDVVRSLQAANQANPVWQRVDAISRREKLEGWLTVLDRRVRDFAQAQSLDQGTSFPLALRSCERALKIAHQCLQTTALETQASTSAAISSDSVSRGVLAPLGVVAILSSWMDAFETTLVRLLPALSAGNVVIWKASEFAPRTAQLQAEVFAELISTGAWPTSLVQVLQGRGESVGRALVIHPGVHTLSFTGRSETARQILNESSEGLKRTHFSLGSRNPVLVFQETELAQLIPQLIELCVKQTGCKRGSRVFVQESIYQPFLESFKAALEAVKIGNPLLDQTDLGPLISGEVQTQFNATVALAISERAKLLNDEPEGLPKEGFFVAPKALYDLTYCSTIQQAEVIGPLITITSFKYQHEAVKHAGNSPYGSIGYIFCDDPLKAQKVAEKLDVAKVILNSSQDLDDQSRSTMGLRQSGLGALGYRQMIRFFSRETAIFGR